MHGGAHAKVHVGVHVQRCASGCMCKGVHRGAHTMVCMGCAHTMAYMRGAHARHVCGGVSFQLIRLC